MPIGGGFDDDFTRGLSAEEAQFWRDATEFFQRQGCWQTQTKEEELRLFFIKEALATNPARAEDTLRQRILDECIEEAKAEGRATAKRVAWFQGYAKAQALRLRKDAVFHGVPSSLEVTDEYLARLRAM